MLEPERYPYISRVTGDEAFLVPEPRESDDLAKVLKYAVSNGYSYFRVDGKWIVLRPGGDRFTNFASADFAAHPRQVARSLHTVLKADIAERPTPHID